MISFVVCDIDHILGLSFSYIIVDNLVDKLFQSLTLRNQ